MSPATFLGMAQDLMRDADAKAAFDADPDGFLAARGFDGLSPDDLHDAVGFVAETLPAHSVAALVDAAGGADGLDLGHLVEVPPEQGGGEPTTTPALEGDEEPDFGGDDVEPDGDPDVAFGHGATDDVAEHLVADDEDGTSTADPAVEDPGVGVSWAPEDADDASPADPAFAHLLDDPLHAEVDPSLAADLAAGDAADPIGEALGWALDAEDDGHQVADVADPEQFGPGAEDATSPEHGAGPDLGIPG